jgi:adenylate kinase family enzyme
VTLRVLILGASGTGTTTLGRALGNDLAFRVFDTDDYYWLPSTPPFQRKQDPAVRLAKFRQDLEFASPAIISGSILNWGLEVEDSLSLIVFLTVPAAVRAARLEVRRLEDECVATRSEMIELPKSRESFVYCWSRSPCPRISGPRPRLISS